MSKRKTTRWRRMGQRLNFWPWFKQRIAAMAYNFSGMPKEALQTVKKAIAVDPEIGYPYATLAEIHALSGDMEAFYKTLETAFQKGMNPAAISMDIEPYQSLAGDARFQKLRQKYQPSLKG